jgi:hypothetical protein
MILSMEETVRLTPAFEHSNRTPDEKIQHRK